MSAQATQPNIWYNRVARLPLFRGPGAALFGILGALTLWGLALLTSGDLNGVNDFGLVAVLNPVFFAAFLVLVVSFVAQLRQPHPNQVLLFLHIAALVVMLHGTPAMLYAAPRYGWTFKHLGVVDYIQTFGYVTPGIDVYHDWPGFFAFFAYFNELAGLDSAVHYALYSQVVNNFLFLGAILLIMQALTPDQRVLWLSGWFFVLTNWVAQDYFAPQALGYFFFLVVLGILLTWFRRHISLVDLPYLEWPGIRRVAPLWRKLVGWLEIVATDAEPTPPLQRVGIVAVLLACGLAIIASHQLTPMMMISTLFMLVIFRTNKLNTLPILLTMVTMVWVTHMAFTSLVDRNDWYSSVGDVSSNVEGSLSDLSKSSRGRTMVAMAARLLSAGIWGLAMLGGARRLFLERKLDLLPVLLIGGVVPVIATQAYGGEILFRAFLFTLPGIVFFAAVFFFPTMTSAVGRWATATLLGANVVLVGLMVLAYYGNEQMNRFTPAEIAASQYVYEHAPDKSLLLSVNFNYPTLFTERYSVIAHAALLDRYTWLVDYRDFIYQDIDASKLPLIVRALDRTQYTDGFFIVTRSQLEHVQLHGTLSEDSFETLVELLNDSPDFEKYYQNNDAIVFRLIE